MDEEREARDPDSDPDDRETAYDLLQRGQALLERRHFAQAAIVLERADRQEPSKGSILEALGRAYFNSGQAERARAAFESLLDIEPSSHYAHYAIGQSFKRLGETGRARTHLRLAVALAPRNALYAAALARLPSPDPAGQTAADGGPAPDVPPDDRGSDATPS
jgi:tetratricopeptide (TPR) repeat protein